jgi:hypothetical protein
MKKKYLLFFIGILILSVPAFGQKTVVVVEPDVDVEIGALNDAIAAAETAGTAGNTIFELRRNGIYFLNGSIAHSGYTLHIRTEAGTGSKAVLQPSVDETGDSDKHFKVSGDLILEQVYVLGRDEIGGMVTQPIDVLGGNCRIIVDNCVMDYSSQSLVATHSADNAVFVKNSILRNCLRPPNPSNGRVIDTRGNGNDTLWISNNTIYNNGATQLRSDGGAILFAKFDHNTVFQTSFAHEMRLDYIREAHITNNLFYNYVYRARSQVHRQLFSCDSIFVGIVTALGYDDADRYFDLSNNNYYVDDTIGAILDEYGPDGLYMFYDWDPGHQDTIWYRHGPIENWFAADEILALNEPEGVPDMLAFIENGQVDTTGLFKEKIEFENPPPLNLDYWKFYTENAFQISGTNPPNPFADEDPLVLGEVQTGAYNFRYNTDSRSYTAADDGLPLGASKWWEAAVSTKDLKLYNGVKTFPNPFDNQVTFKIDASEASAVNIQVFDLLGREIHTVYRTANQGINEFTVNLGDLSRSGIFLYKIQFKTKNGLKSISSGKIIKR